MGVSVVGEELECCPSGHHWACRAKPPRQASARRNEGNSICLRTVERKWHRRSIAPGIGGDVVELEQRGCGELCTGRNDAAQDGERRGRKGEGGVFLAQVVGDRGEGLPEFGVRWVWLAGEAVGKGEGGKEGEKSHFEAVL